MSVGHAKYYDIPTLLERNKLWNDQSQKYLIQVVTDCVHCKASSTPQLNR